MTDVRKTKGQCGRSKQALIVVNTHLTRVSYMRKIETCGHITDFDLNLKIMIL